MKVLITGGNGFLGQHLTRFLSAQNFEVYVVSRGECRIPDGGSFTYFDVDLRNSNELAAIVNEVQPGVIIHAAAMSKPDECKNNPQACLQLNVDATRDLLNAFNATQQPSLFIYISTDFVFGENGPHSEDEEKGPLNFYGESKYTAEQLVEGSNLPHAIVRPVFIYGPTWNGLRPSFLHWVKNSLEQNKQIKVVSDQLRTPTYVVDICKGIAEIINRKKEGVYHLAGKDFLSPYEMAVKTAGILGLDATLIQNVTSECFDEPVIRAKRSGLKIDKAMKELDYVPVSFEDGIRYTFNI
ncbi:SDR family oxidoreductase [Danxiaibacter flavus]|uniref:SDR family oxidoreductase n=1 Tax=Danxiaibacter flavus TaxID=3049108 RepID=A0ABV3ZAA6_9BACT|nr:SDR family oxidoreductase [Chitinophagaceae bacterium DXS]